MMSGSGPRVSRQASFRPVGSHKMCPRGLIALDLSRPVTPETAGSSRVARAIFFNHLAPPSAIGGYFWTLFLSLPFQLAGGVHIAHRGELNVAIGACSFARLRERVRHLRGQFLGGRIAGKRFSRP